MTKPVFQSDRRQAMLRSVAWLGAVVSPLTMAQSPVITDDTWQDIRRQRVVPVRIRWPQGTAPADGWPVVIYSHGLGGSREGGDVWGNAWVSAGLVVVHLQHAGSDFDAARSVTRNFQDRAALRTLGSSEQLMARLQDVVFALDEIARLRVTVQAWRNIRADAVGVAGHSFGAHTAFGVGGQIYPNAAGMKEPRIAALIALSPALPAHGNATQAFSKVTLPLLCVTGTLDGDVIGNGATPDKRAAVFGALPEGNKAMLLLSSADHMTFGGATSRAAVMTPRETVTTRLQPQHQALVARITTDFWLAHLTGDATARARLRNPAGLSEVDSWQTG